MKTGELANFESEDEKERNVYSNLYDWLLGRKYIQSLL